MYRKILSTAEQKEEAKTNQHQREVILNADGSSLEPEPVSPISNQTTSQRPLPSEVTNNFKALMVDQLWSWIVDDKQYCDLLS
jgi:hypothetical protein